MEPDENTCRHLEISVTILIDILLTPEDHNLCPYVDSPAVA